jgi:hypothetical protein
MYAIFSLKIVCYVVCEFLLEEHVYFCFPLTRKRKTSQACQLLLAKIKKKTILMDQHIKVVMSHGEMWIIKLPAKLDLV